MLYTVQETLRILQNEGICHSEQVVRRWLRAGVLVGQRASRKTGWRISEEAVTTFIHQRKFNGTQRVTKEERQAAYQEGYAAGRHDTIVQLLCQGYGQSTTLRRSTVRYFVKRATTDKNLQKKILDWLFGQRPTLNLHVLDEQVFLYDRQELVSYTDEETMAEKLAQMAQTKVIAGEARVHPWVG
ncbi:MAG: hypothetical protein ABF969_01145 [Sporolactobacillus sp.]